MNSTDATPRLLLPLIMPSQAQKHVTHNEALTRLDQFAHPVAVTRTTTVPPIDAAADTAYLVPVDATGAWLGRAGEVAVAAGAGWTFVSPFVGLKLYVEDEDRFLYFDGADWMPFGNAVSTTTTLGINAAADATTRLSVASAAVAFSHDPAGVGDSRVAINKADTTGTASLLFQSGWNGRAEIGLTGSNTLSVKTSADGAAWTTAATFAQDGSFNAPYKVTVGEDVASAGTLTVAQSNPTLSLRDTAGTGNAHLGIVNWVDATGTEKVWCGLGSASNTAFTFLSHYPDGINFYAYGGDYPILFRQDANIRINVHTNGNVGIHEAAPTAPLHVAGAARVGGFTIASLPSATAMGPGAIVFVSDDAAGATLAFSDGSVWRRVHDRQPVA